MAWNLVDVLMSLALVLGLLRGLLRGTGVMIGGLAGLAAGALLARWLLRTVDLSALDPRAQLLVALGGALAVLVLGMAAGETAGAALLGSPPRRAVLLSGLDRILGGAVGVSAAAVVCLLAGSALLAGAWPAGAAQARDSRVLDTVRQAVPHPVQERIRQMPRALGAGDGLRRLDQLIAPAAPPPSGGVSDPQVLAAADSAVQVVGEAPRCGVRSTGSGFAASGGRVVTNAHVVRGTETLSVRTPSGERARAAVIGYDPAQDLAVLSAPDLRAPALPLADPPEPGARAAFAGYPGGGPLRVGAAALQGRARAAVGSIDGSASGAVEVLQFAGDVRQGDSGGPLLDGDGRVIGVVFARSDPSAAGADQGQAGYALTVEQVRRALDDSAGRHEPVPTGDCSAAVSG